MDLISGINTSGLYARYADSALKDSDGNIITATYLTAHQNISADEWNESYETITANSAEWNENDICWVDVPGESFSFIDDAYNNIKNILGDDYSGNIYVTNGYDIIKRTAHITAYYFTNLDLSANAFNVYKIDEDDNWTRTTIPFISAHQDISNKLDTTSFSTVSGTFLTAHQDISATEWNETYDTVTANSAQWSESTEYSAGRGIEIDDDVIQIADSAYSAISGTPWSFIDGPNTRVIADSGNNTLAISAGAGGGESKEVSAGQGISIEETTDNIVIGITDSAYSAISGTPWTFVDGTNTRVVTNTANNTISISAGAGGSTGEYLPLSGGDLSGDVTINDATLHINEYHDGTRVNNVADVFAYNSAAWIKARTSGDANENMAALGVTLSGGVPLVELQIGPNGVNGWNSWEIRNIYPMVIHPSGTTASQSWANDNTLHIILEE